MILGFTGTRLGPTPAQHGALRQFVRRFRPSRFVHGGCVGSDTLAHNAVRACCPDICIEIHPSNIPGTQGATVTVPMGNCEIYPELPPLERDRIIVRRIHGLLACPRSDREDVSGTWTTVRYAREIDCPVYVISERGKIFRDREGL